MIKKLQILKAIAFTFMCITAGISATNAQNISTAAGNGTAGFSDGTPATAQMVYRPSGSVFYSGKLYFADGLNNRIRVYDPIANSLSTFAGTGASTQSGNNGQALSAGISNPVGIKIDVARNVMYIAELGGNSVRQINLTTNIIKAFAGAGGVNAFSGDGGLATSARLGAPHSVAVDASGNVYIADYSNSRIRKVTLSTGIISTLIGNGSNGNPANGATIGATIATNGPISIDFDSNGDLYYSNDGNVVRRIVLSTNKIYNFAGTYNSTASAGDGGLATAASFNYIYGIAFDNSDNLYVADLDANNVREIVSATGKIGTVAGTGTAGYSGDGGKATAAKLDKPTNLATDNSGGLFISDWNNQVIRYVLSVSTILPVALLNFTVTATTAGAVLTWATATETNNKGFAIEHSSDGVSFSQIGFVASNGNSTGQLAYSFADAEPLQGNNFYRLKQVDFDGTAVYSSIQKVSVGLNSPKKISLNVYPNPISTNSKIVVNGIVDFSHATIIITNSLGQIMLKQTISGNITPINFFAFPNGTYNINYKDAVGNNLWGKVVK